MGNQGLQGNYGNYNLGWNSHQSMGQAKSSNRPPHQQNVSHCYALKYFRSYLNISKVTI